MSNLGQQGILQLHFQFKKVSCSRNLCTQILIDSVTGLLSQVVS